MSTRAPSSRTISRASGMQYSELPWALVHFSTLPLSLAAVAVKVVLIVFCLWFRHRKCGWATCSPTSSLSQARDWLSSSVAHLRPAAPDPKPGAGYASTRMGCPNAAPQKRPVSRSSTDSVVRRSQGSTCSERQSIARRTTARPGPSLRSETPLSRRHAGRVG